MAKSLIDEKPTQVRLIVTCSNRKTNPIPDSYRLRAVAGATLAARLRSWIELLAKALEPPTSARHLYAGEHWSVARSVGDSINSGIRVDLWVCSAGYGLIPDSAPIVPYAATFSTGQADSVPCGAKGATAWWNGLSDWEGPVGGVRSLTDLIGIDRSARVLLVLSEAYLKACRADISRSLNTLTSSKRLSIISAGAKLTGDLREFQLPSDARLQAVFGGSLQALNIRTVDHLLSAGIADHDEMSETLKKMLADAPKLIRYGRLTATDSEVLAFIRAQLLANPRVSRTSLLREFRSGNRACEQARFANLFEIESRASL